MQNSISGNLACLIVVYYVVLPVRAIAGSSSSARCAPTLLPPNLKAGAWLTVGIPVLYLVFTVPKSEKDGGLVPWPD